MKKSRSLADRYLAAPSAAPFCVSPEKFPALALAARIQPRLPIIPIMGLAVAAPTLVAATVVAHSAASERKRMTRDAIVTVPKTENSRSLADRYLAAPSAASTGASQKKFHAMIPQIETDAYVRTFAAHPTTRQLKWSRPLLTGTDQQTEIDLTRSKQTTNKFLTGARTHISLSRKRISNRELTMRRASASRARSATRGICSAFSNRELLGLEFPQLADNKRSHPVLIANFEPNDFRVVTPLGGMKHWRQMDYCKTFAGCKGARAVAAFLALATLLCTTTAYAQGAAPINAQAAPQPPCGGTEPVPAYASPNDPPNVKAWSKAELGRDWKPPACSGWTAVGFTALVTTAARFRFPEDVDGLLHHIGAISQLKGMRYWSNTHKRWQTLVVDAYALTGVQHSGREDFTFNELKAGKELYFLQVDNISGKAIYRLHIDEASRDRIVFDIENENTMRYFLVPVFHPGELQSIYFLDRESEHVWRYYSMLRMGKNANGMAAGNESSAINRAVAFYRWLAGIPTDREPPAAR